MILSAPTTVTEIFERRLTKESSGSHRGATFATSEAGWYIQLDDMISIFAGKEKPEFGVGDKLLLTLRKVT